MDYDNIASGYDELYGEEQNKKAALILSHAKIKGKVLDVGCGSGKTSELFGDVIGIDPSIELLKYAKIPVVQGMAEELPFKDGSFDWAVCLTAIHHTDHKKAILEMERVAANIAITILKKSSKHEEILKEIMKRKPTVISEQKDTILLYSTFAK